MTHGLLLGHSHIGCIQTAVADQDPGLDGLTLELAPQGAAHFQPNLTLLLSAIRALIDKPIWHLQSPPPVPDSAHLCRNAQHFPELIRACGLASPARAAEVK